LKYSNLFIYFILKDIARCCLDNGADVNSLNKEGNTPLFCAAEKFSKSCAKVKRKIKKFQRS